VHARRYEPARVSAALAVTAVVAGWGIAQEPDLLPGLTIEEAAAGDATLVALLISLAVGSLILIPALALLFGLVLRGRFDEEAPAVPEPPPHGPGPGPGRALPVAAVLAAVGAPLALVFEGFVLGAGILALVLAVAVGAVALLDPAALDAGEGEAPGR
jgi:cytochrome d ubiquinol oxidase subunit II